MNFHDWTRTMLSAQERRALEALASGTFPDLPLGSRRNTLQRLYLKLRMDGWIRYGGNPRILTMRLLWDQGYRPEFHETA